MVLDASLLNTQHYKVRIKGKVEQSREGVVPSPTIGVVAIEKGAFGLPSTMVPNFTYLSVWKAPVLSRYMKWSNGYLAIYLDEWPFNDNRYKKATKYLPARLNKS